MNKGMEILLSRMDSHPDEFELEWSSGPYAVEGSRWSNVFHHVRMRVNNVTAINSSMVDPLPFATDEEVRALYDKWVSLQGPAFERYVMRELLEGEKKSEPGPFGAPPWNNSTSNMTGAAQCNTSSKSMRISSNTLKAWGTVVEKDEPDG